MTTNFDDNHILGLENVSRPRRGRICATMCLSEFDCCISRMPSGSYVEPISLLEIHVECL